MCFNRFHGAPAIRRESLDRRVPRMRRQMLVHRLPGLQLAIPPEQLEFKSDHAIYGIRELPVTW